MNDDDLKIIEQRKQDLREIAVVIDSWDDVFSDFDPSPLGQRTVSGDFIAELKKRYYEDRKGDFVVSIYAPKSLENSDSEKMVTQRLKKHFRHRFLQRKKDAAVIRLRGAIFVCVGIFSLSFLTLATYYKFLSQVGIEIIGIILMPLGWFGIWEGLSKIVDSSPAFAREDQLFEKFAKASYRFKYIQE